MQSDGRSSGGACLLDVHINTPVQVTNGSLARRLLLCSRSPSSLPVSDAISRRPLVLTAHDLSRLSLLHIDLVPGHYSAIMVADRAFDAISLRLSVNLQARPTLGDRLRRAMIRDVDSSAIAIYARQTYGLPALSRTRSSGATVHRKRFLPIVSRR